MKDEGRSPKGFFNPIIPTHIFAPSRNSEGYFRHPTSHAYRKSCIKPPGGLFISNTFERGIIGTGGRGGLFNLAKTIVSVVHKELEYKEEKLKYKKLEEHAAEDQKPIRTSGW